MLTFIETSLFTRLVLDYLTDEEYLELQAALASDPEVGAVMPGSGGVRKLRWSFRGKGKRGGLRVIYYLRSREGVIWDAHSVSEERRAEHPGSCIETDS